MMSSILRVIIIMIHPLLAIGILFWMHKQYQYRNKRLELRDQVAYNYRAQHEKSGRRIHRSALIVTIIGFISNFIVGFSENNNYSSLFPSSLHGWFGIIGIILLSYIVRSGKIVKSNRESGKAFTYELQKHGRASDLVMMLLILHAFLGFIYLFQLLVF